MSPEASPQGLLIAVVGPSGAGKDTVTRLALEGLGGNAARFAWARRTVTRTADCAFEDHDSLDETAFVRAEAAGAFCLTWRANGLAYGLPADIQTEVAAGATIIANLSRRSLADAARRFGRIAIVEVSAQPDLLAARIVARGRETPSEIAGRLSRNVPVQALPGTVALLRIDNSGSPEDAAAALRHFLIGLLDRNALSTKATASMDATVGT